MPESENPVAVFPPTMTVPLENTFTPYSALHVSSRNES